MNPVILYEQVLDRVIETDDLPRVVDPNMIIDRTNTVFDPEIMRNGCWVELGHICMDYAGREINRIWVPGIYPMEDQGMWVVHPVMWMANQIARIQYQIQRGVTPRHALQKMVWHYQAIAERELVGKTGLIRQVIIGARMKQSGRAVLVPNGSYHPEEVGIPGRFFDPMGIDHHDLILIGRNPTVWSGSIEIVKAIRSSDDVVELHPLLFEQLGGDCDGDDVYFVPIPKKPGCQSEAQDELLSFCIQNAKWKKQGLAEVDNTEVDWEDVKADTRARFAVTGWSVGPEDILNQSPEMEKLERITGKELAEPCHQIATRLDWESVRSIITDKNFETLRMKKHLGLVGIACNRLKVMAGRVPDWVDSANYMSERLQQTLLDSKHLDGSYSVFDLLAILNKKGEWRGASIKTAINAITVLGNLDVERCRPIMVAVYLAYPWMAALEQVLPVTISRGPIHATIRKMGTCIKTSSVIHHLEKQLVDLGMHAHLPTLRGLSIQLSTGLNSLATQFYPLHEAIASREPKRGLTKRIFNRGEIDINGPCQQAWEVWHDMAGVK